MNDTYDWRKSSYTSGQGNCVEVATNLDGIIAVRDSKNPRGPVLAFAPDEWDAFTTGIKAGEFNLP
jgi:hypothetical protein